MTFLVFMHFGPPLSEAGVSMRQGKAPKAFRAVQDPPSLRRYGAASLADVWSGLE